MDTKVIAKMLVESAAVLLKNENHTLPFTQCQKVAFFGRAQLHTYFSGNGSGASQALEELNILEECEKKGVSAESGLKEFYKEALARDEASKEPEFDFTKVKEVVNSGIMYEIFGRYHAPETEYEIPDTLLEAAKKYTDTAVIVIGRNSGGEECDRHLDEDYYLTTSEKRLVSQVCQSFKDVVLILNINGLIDLAWTLEYENIRSILFLGVCGEQGAAAMAEILTGKVNPSGKLPVTIARDFDDYPSAKHFSWKKDTPDKLLTYENYGLNAQENGSYGYDKSPVTVYQEDIYAGYRYFDTFGKKPLYPFGFGLSYTEFSIDNINARKHKNELEIKATVKNTGNVSGREVVQLYISPIGTRSERPYQELKGFEKTNLLKAGESEEISIFVPWKELGCYDEEKAAYVIEKGIYQVRVGNSSANTKTVSAICVEKDIVVQKLRNRLGIRACNKGKIEFLSQGSAVQRACEAQRTEKVEVQTFILQEKDIVRSEKISDETGKKNAGDLQEDNFSADLRDFSIEELAALCVGYGPGTPFSAFGDRSEPETILNSDGKPLTQNNHPTGFNGYVSPAMEDKHIDSVFYKDGTSGIGEIAWPSEMLIACAFDKKLWCEFGDAIGIECEKQKVDFWLAPAVNLHRNPLCGRNFEYISEDPYLTGICACEIARGVQEDHPVRVCPKHFAMNEQETYRRGSAKKNYDAVDSILTERAARELYLKPFEMLVKEAHVTCMMSSFNKINGVFAGGNADLCTHILREEWGFDGAVVTDWGDMDIVVDGADAIKAGNDIVMPGGPPVIMQIIKGYEEGRVSRCQLEMAVIHLLQMIKSINRPV